MSKPRSTSSARFEPTELERSVLTFAAHCAGDDLDHMALSGPDKAAYDRAMGKLRANRSSALTVLELRVLLFTASCVGDDIDHIGLRAVEKAAYDRAMGKVRCAIRERSTRG